MTSVTLNNLFLNDLFIDIFCTTGFFCMSNTVGPGEITTEEKPQMDHIPKRTSWITRHDVWFRHPALRIFLTVRSTVDSRSALYIGGGGVA